MQGVPRLIYSTAFRAAVVVLYAVGALLFLLVGFGSANSNNPSVNADGTPVPPRNALVVVMWSSGEKMNYLKDLAAQFNQERHTTGELFSDGTSTPIWIEAYTVNSGPMSDMLVAKLRDGQDFPEGITPPIIASPSVDHWLSRVNYLTGNQVFDLEKTKDLARTPVIIGTYEEMARALGWPDKQLGWADIIALATDPRGWTAYPASKIEWGAKPLLAWTDPYVSSTARSALFATTSAAANKPAEQLTNSDVADPRVQEYLRSLQSSVDHYFPETLKLQTKLFQGPRFVHFAPLEEYMLVWLRTGKVNAESLPGGKVEQKPLDRKMVAIYPREGTVWHNNPGAILQNVPWTSVEHQRAAQIWIDWLLRPENQQKAMEWGFRPAIEMPYGPYLTPEYGINPNEPKTLLGRVEPGVAESIMNGWKDVKKPGIAVLVMDVSGSMQGEPLRVAKAGAKRFLENMSPNNRVGLVVFSDRVLTTVPVGPLSDVRYLIAETVDEQRASGGTALYDAVQAGITLADEAPLETDAIRGVVLLTDGKRTDGTVKLSDLVTLFTRGERPVTDFVGDENDAKTELVGSGLAIPTQHTIHVFAVSVGEDVDFEALRILSEATNSTFNRASEADLEAILERYGKYF